MMSNEKEVVVFSRQIRRGVRTLRQYEGSIVHIVDGRSRKVVVSVKVIPIPDEVAIPPETYVPEKKTKLSEQKDEERVGGNVPK